MPPLTRDGGDGGDGCVEMQCAVATLRAEGGAVPDTPPSPVVSGRSNNKGPTAATNPMDGAPPREGWIAEYGATTSRVVRG